jgi:hypothetical protein
MTILKKQTKPLLERPMMDMQTGEVKRILILAANPGDTGRLSLDKEFREIQTGLNRAKYRHRFELHPRLAVRFSDIRQALLDYNPHIVHFAGHGDKNGLMVEDELGLSVPVTAQVLSQLFELCAQHVECVILNACYSDSQATAINTHIKYVIGMKKEIEDRAAIEFAIGFYDALGAGKPVDDAFKFGRIAILQVSPGLPKHLTPILRKRKEQKITIQLHIESTRRVYEFEVSHNESTLAVKKGLIDDLKLAGEDEDGEPVIYHLFSKTRNVPLEDNKTLRENGVQNDEILVFLVQIDNTNN